MNLKKYREKRNFSSTQEPEGKKKKKKGLTFVVQRHDASHLHYDFRLELNGVLKSWAVPKGPSMNASDKRLAIEVEDHPLEYGKFSGTIPKGNYGAGTVEIWDNGTYSAEGCETIAESEEQLNKEYKKGHMHFILDGKKLKGSFSLVKIQKQDTKKNQWLLIKSSKEKKTSQKKPVKQPMPHSIKPMLATLYNEPFDDPNWLFEIKWDGYRAITEVENSTIQLYSRNLISFSSRFPKIIEDLKNFKDVSLILDGEIVVLDSEGKPSFQLLQNILQEKKESNHLRYYVFDLIYFQGRDLRNTPLTERKKLLKQVLQTAHLKYIFYCDHVEEKGVAFFKALKKQEMEGMIAKQMQSVYESKRSKEWLKIKTHARQEVVIAGFTEPQGSRELLGALIAAVYEKGVLRYAGHIGGGFNQKSLKEIYRRLKPLVTKNCPFKIPPKTNTKATWVKPQLVCEVSFQEWTKDGQLRQPIFQGLREDKDPKDVKEEKAMEAPPPNSPLSEYSFITHPGKIFWPNGNYTKGDLLEYYASISSYILPHLKNRPEVLHRFPNGIEGVDFYQKEIPANPPAWIKTVEIEHSEKNIHYLLIQDLKSLLYAVNLGSIEIHPFMSRIDSIDQPDFAVMDLDPGTISFSKVIEVARYIHQFLEESDIPSYCKTSGKTGLHIYVPLGDKKYTYEQSTQFIKLIAHITNKAYPKITSMERSPDKRKKQIYLDYLQNSRSKTVVAPYSVRPVAHASISTPLKWSEVKEGLDPSAFTIRNGLKRFEKYGDLFAPVLKEHINMRSCLEKLEKYL